MRIGKRKEIAFLLVLSIGITCLWMMILYYFLYFAQPQSMQNTQLNAAVQAYEQKFLMFLPFAVVPMVLLTFLCLWAIYKLGSMKIQKQLIKEIRKEMPKKDNDPLQDDVVSLFKNLQTQYDTKITETKRLNSYISHEQKNELAVLKVLLSDVEDEAALTSIAHLQNNLEDILTLCDVSENLSVLDSAQICATVCDTYQTTYPNITFTFDEEANLMMLGKERWLRRAISNLLHNAIKYGNGNAIHVSLTNTNHSVQILVKDEGIGMEETFLSDIMKFGYQISHGKNDGYGIGLNLVHHVCKLCGGFIWIESEKMNGTKVYLSFPQAM